MKNNPEPRDIPVFIRKLLPASFRKAPAIAWSGAFFICLLIILLNQGTSHNVAGTIDDFEVGRVADRDVIAERSLTFRDERATSLRIAAQERLVPAVFYYSHAVTERLQGNWDQFADLVISLSEEAAALAAGEYPDEVDPMEVFRLAIQAEFPGYFPDDVLDLLYESGDQQGLLQSSTAVLDAVLEMGIFYIPPTGLERLNPEVLELIRHLPGRIEQERLFLDSVITRDTAAEAAAAHFVAGHHPPMQALLSTELLRPFLRENVFFSMENTALRVAEIRATTEPVMRTVEQGDRVIKRGFIITEDEVADLAALRMTFPVNDARTVFADIIFLLLLFGLLCYFCGSRTIGRSLRDSEVYLLSGLSALYIAGSVFMRNLPIGNFPVSVLVPTALVMMLPAILVHPRLALVLAMGLPLGAFLTGSFDIASYVFALASGVVAAYALQGAEKRMDLIKAGLVIAAANILAMIAVLLWQRFPAAAYPQALFWAAFNGIASGMLVLGLLPLLENALNASTSFRLIELSDLNAPIMRRLFTTAPGTYSHSVLVANLAETACLDINADPLLARVGAYYHDLGKMENPDYFVENQTDYNRHDGIAPRLSATVIRSHVKLGVEKARQLRLPGEVIDIIGEHHGNSVITWFYDKAVKQEDKNKRNAQVNTEDFCYPGTPPRSRESAVVMLADVSEAAVRTLDKPTAVKIEKFIQSLFEKKVESGQLSQSELTFRELEVIKNAFVRVLVAYHHSRIEYPKADSAVGSEETGKA